MTKEIPMTPEDSVSQLVAPNGRRLKLQKYANNPALFEVAYDDDKGGELPDIFKDQKFTKRNWGEEWIKFKLSGLWDSAMKSNKSRAVNA